MKRMAIITALITALVASSLTASAEETLYSENSDSKVIEDLKEKLEDSKDDIETVMNKVKEQYATSSACQQLEIELDYFISVHESTNNFAKALGETSEEEIEAAKIASEIAIEYEKAITKLQETYIIPLCSSTALDTQTSNIFSDLSESHKNYDAIAYLKENGIINGYDDGTFKPENKINRAEFLKILVEGTGISPDKNTYKNCFPDVKEEWFAPYICYAKEKNWISGYPDNTFKPAQTVNKVEAIKMILNTQNIDIPTNISTQPFDDVPVDAWFAPFVKVAKDMDILEETGNNLSTSEDMTRAGVSENLYRTLTYLENSSHKATINDEQEESNEEDNQHSEPITISGTGETVSEEFYLEDGLTFATLNYNGSNNFIVKLLSVDSDNTEYLANEIDNYSGKEVFKVEKSGNYILDINSSGNWDVTFEQPTNVTSGETLDTLSGNGSIVSKFIEIDEGFYKFDASHQGDSNFIVELIDLNGDTEAYIANEIGNYEGTKGEYINEGIYLLSVKAGGEWSIEFEEVQTSENPSVQNSFSGSGDTITSLFKIEEGLKIFDLSHQGDSNFIVHLISTNGSTEVFLSNEIGNFNGSTAEFINDGNYFIQVEADGDWSIAIE